MKELEYQKYLESAIGNLTVKMRELETILKEARPRPLAGIGRKPLDIPVKNVYDALRNSTSVLEAVQSLRVSRGYIYDRVPEPKAYLKGATV